VGLAKGICFLVCWFGRRRGEGEGAGGGMWNGCGTGMDGWMDEWALWVRKTRIWDRERIRV